MTILEKIFLLTCACASFSWMYAHEYEKIDLDSAASSANISVDMLKEFPAVVLKNQVMIEYLYENGQLLTFQTIHKRVLVVNDKGVDYYNRVYIPFARTRELVNITVRSVSPSGNITVMDKSNIKEIENLEDKGAYRIFAIEGVEKGSIVEYVYTLRNELSTYGSYTFQDDVPVFDASFKLVTPVNLTFMVKGYNASFERIDTLIDKTFFISLTSDTLPALREEKYSTYRSNLARVEYNFSTNVQVNSVSKNTWNVAAKNLYDAYYAADKKSEKKIKKMIQKLYIDTMGEKSKIKTIENYLKDNFQMKQYNGIDDIESLSSTLKNRYTNEEGFTRLFCKFFQVAGINHQLGCTSDRFYNRFDREFMTWRYLYDYLIYLPDINSYLSPSSVQYRLGILPDGQLNNDALFLKVVNIENYTSVLSDIKKVETNPVEQNFTNQTADIRIDGDRAVAQVHYRHELGGYEANYIQPFYDFIPDEKKREVMEDMLKIMGKDTKVIDYKVENTDHNVSALEKPFVVDGNVEVSSLIEKAGSSIILNIGNVIGEQVQMYDEHERQNPVELEFPHQYFRKIDVTIPDGYQVKGLESLTIDKQYGNGAMGFVSGYQVEGNKLKVTVREYYHDVTYPLSTYPDFRTVINAAADFNKISIVFEKM